MAVRFESTAEAYTRTLSLASQPAITVTAWVKISVDTGTYATAWVIDNGASDYISLKTDISGTLMRALTNDGGTLASREFTVGTWYFAAIATGSTAGRLVTRAVGDSSFTTVTWTNAHALTATTLRLAVWPSGGEGLNGCLAGLKVWTGDLSQAEIEAEAFQYLPARTANLRAWYPLLQPQTTDYSGNGQTLSGGSGASTEDGPPIRWGGGRTRIVLPDSRVVGELAASLPALGAVAEGDVTASGSLAAGLPALTGEATGELTAAGQADAVLPALTGGLTGVTTTPALLAATLPALTGSFEGELTGGFLTPTLPALTGQMTGQLRAHGELAATLPALTGALTGHVPIPHNNIDVTAGTPRRGWAARPAAIAWTADTSSPAWATRAPATGWTADAPARGWRTLQPTT